MLIVILLEGFPADWGGEIIVANTTLSSRTGCLLTIPAQTTNRGEHYETQNTRIDHRARSNGCLGNIASRGRPRQTRSPVAAPSLQAHRPGHVRRPTKLCEFSGPRLWTDIE